MKTYVPWMDCTYCDTGELSLADNEAYGPYYWCSDCGIQVDSDTLEPI